jgi:hypothetical protein
MDRPAASRRPTGKIRELFIFPLDYVKQHFSIELKFAS